MAGPSVQWHPSGSSPYAVPWTGAKRTAPNADRFGAWVVLVLLAACTAVAVLDLLLMLDGLR